MRYLTPEEMLILHALVIDDTGGSHGVRDVALLQSVAHKPTTSFGGSDMYPDLFQKAAVLCEALVNYHVFIDGNKRTGMTAAARFLFLNGYEFAATNEDFEETVLALATKSLTVDQLALWLKKNAKPVSKPRGSI